MPKWKSHNEPVTHDDLSALLEHINRLKNDMADNIEAIATLNQRTQLIANQLVDCMTSVNFILDVLKEKGLLPNNEPT